jgi:hypothetical protein
MTTHLSASEVVRRWSPGSADWSWAQEFADLLRTRPDEMADLVLDVGRRGVQEPILLGDDDRVWDGHHRIFAALLTDSRLPVYFGFTKANHEAVLGQRRATG